MPSWGKFWTKDTKRPKNPTVTSEEPQAKARGQEQKAGHCACPQLTTPRKGWASHLSHPSGLTPGRVPTLTPYKEPAWPP